MSNETKTHYVTELKKELAEAKARIALADSFTHELACYLLSDKFRTHSTVEVKDVLHRIDNLIKPSFYQPISHYLNPQFVDFQGVLYVQLQAKIYSNKFLITNKEGNSYPYEVTRATDDDRPNESEFGVINAENCYDGSEHTIRLTVRLAVDLGLI